MERLDKVRAGNQYEMIRTYLNRELGAETAADFSEYQIQIRKHLAFKAETEYNTDLNQYEE